MVRGSPWPDHGLASMLRVCIWCGAPTTRKVMVLAIKEKIRRFIYYRRDRGATWSKQLFLDPSGPETASSHIEGLATSDGDVLSARGTVWRRRPEGPFAPR